MANAARPSKRVLIRDLLILNLKLVIDAVKDVLLIKLAIFAVIFDLLFGREGRPVLFYNLLRLGEKFDLWLNLYGAARGAEDSEDGLFGASRSGSPSMLGRLEQMVTQRVEDIRSSPETG